MRARSLLAGLGAGSLVSCSALAQPVLYGVTAAGELVRIDAATGAGTLIGASGMGCNAAAADNEGRILIGGGASAQADQIMSLDPATGAGSVFLNTVGRPVGFGVRGMAVCPNGTLYVVLSSATTTVIDTLARINLTSGQYTVIGPTGRTDLQSLMCTPENALFTLGTNSGGQLFSLNAGTGAATLVGPSGLSGDDQAIDFVPGVGAVTARANLRAVDLATGASTLIGATGFADLRGLAVVVPGGLPCYANCDGSTAAPVLNVADFGCFLTKYAAGEAYANCDGSTTSPVLNVADFGCFLTEYAAGCR
ncbi:MAG: hypothetical protein WD749_07975 [Phycisphaerales bacterium]